MRRSIPFAIALAALGPAVRAQVPDCDGLPEARRAEAALLLGALHPYDCCDAPFASCLVSAACPSVRRAAAEICRRVGRGEGREAIERALARRAQSMLPGTRPAAVALDEAARAGEAEAPVVVVLYVCPRCPMCQVLAPALERAVTAGPLRGKARVYLRPFPIKSHPGSREAGLALAAAGRAGALWPFALALFSHFDDTRPERFAAFAAAAGLDPARHAALAAEPATEAALRAVLEEGHKNRVEVTPAVFLNGRRVQTGLEPEVIADLIEEEWERTAPGR